MSQYKIITDSGCDLPKTMLAQLDLKAVPLTVNFRGKDMEDSVDEGIKEMYAGLRAGEPATTSAINPDRWSQEMEAVLSQGMDVLTVTFSSGLSTTYQSAVIAANELQEKYPDRKILVVDSLCASLGQGLLMWYVCKMRDTGMGIEDLAKWIEDNRQNLCMWFTVDDLMYLKRGGRVSRIPNLGSVELVGSHTVPKKNSAAPTSRMAGSPETIRYMLIALMQPTDTCPHSKKKPCMNRSEWRWRDLIRSTPSFRHHRTSNGNKF